MNTFKKIIASTLLLAMASGAISNDLEAQDFSTVTGGCGYEESICAPSLTPYIALGTVVAVAIIAIAVRHNGHHGHSHSSHD